MSQLPHESSAPKPEPAFFYFATELETDLKAVRRRRQAKRAQQLAAGLLLPSQESALDLRKLLAMASSCPTPGGACTDECDDCDKQ